MKKEYPCKMCGEVFKSYSDMIAHRQSGCIKEDEQSKRDPKGYRFDILVPSFLRAMAQIADFGANKYGNLNWQKSRLSGHGSPPNHIMDHLTKYILREPYDHKELGEHRKMHLAAVAFNAMMEWWYEENMPDGLPLSKEHNPKEV